MEKQAASTNTVSQFETEVLVSEKNLRGLRHLNTEWVAQAMARTLHQRIILDMDSSESPLYGEQEGAAYNGHFGCMCYHPLFCFNQFGDCEGGYYGRAMSTVLSVGGRSWSRLWNDTRNEGAAAAFAKLEV